jgi:capsid portal protein
VPDIIAAMDAIAGNRFSAQFNLDYFENKAVPRHVVILKGATINPKLAKNILEFFETGLKGKNHRSLFIPLPGDTNEKKVDLKIEPVEAGVQDSSFNNYRKANLGEILMAHRVPISKVGLAEGVSLAVARDADKTFKEQVSRPEQGTMEKKINRIVKEFTDLFVLKLNELTLTDEDTQSKIDERRRKTGTETANEQRARRGLPSIEGGDELVDLNAAAKVAEARNEMQAQGNRERDSVRSAGATDSAGEGRNPKGEGRTAGG